MGFPNQSTGAFCFCRGGFDVDELMYAYLGIGRPGPGQIDRHILIELLEWVPSFKWRPEDAEYELEEFFISRAEPQWLEFLFELLVDDTGSRFPKLDWENTKVPIYFGRIAARFPEIGVDAILLFLGDERLRLLGLECLSELAPPDRQRGLTQVANQVKSFSKDEMEYWEDLIAMDSGD